jgi:hypothetical protein
MSDTIAYYCGGAKPILELLTSIYSVRKQGWNGKIVVCIGKTSIPHLQVLINSGEVDIIEIPDTEKDHFPREHWTSRWRGMSYVSDDRVLHPDCDMTFVKDPSVFFELLHKDPEYITTFHSVNDGKPFRTWEGHLEEYRKIDQNFDAEPFYIEMGILGWRGRYAHCMEVSEACKITKDDQTAMSYVLMKHGRKAYKPELRHELMRRARAYWRIEPEEYDAVVAWHCHPEYHMWWKFYLEAKEANYMGLADIPTNIYPKVHRTITRNQIPSKNSRPTDP